MRFEYLREGEKKKRGEGMKMPNSNEMIVTQKKEEQVQVFSLVGQGFTFPFWPS